jgi:hypothetical protein
LLGWLILGYVVPWTAALGHRHRPVLQDANGTWFIWVVATQSVAVLAAVLQPELESGRRELALVAVFSWSVGVFLYAVSASSSSPACCFIRCGPKISRRHTGWRWVPPRSPSSPAPASSKWPMPQWSPPPAGSSREHR